MLGILTIVAVIVIVGVGYVIYQEQTRELPGLLEPVFDPTEDISRSEASIQEQVGNTQDDFVVEKLQSDETAEAFQKYYEARLKEDPDIDWAMIVAEFYTLHENDPGIQDYKKWQKLKADYHTQWNALQYPEGISVDSVFLYQYNESPLFDDMPYITTEARNTLMNAQTCGNLNYAITFTDFSLPHVCNVMRINDTVAFYMLGILAQDEDERKADIPPTSVLVNDVLILRDDHFVTLRFRDIIPRHAFYGLAWPTATQNVVDDYFEAHSGSSGNEMWNMVRESVSSELAQPSAEVLKMLNILKVSTEMVLKSL